MRAINIQTMIWVYMALMGAVMLYNVFYLIYRNGSERMDAAHSGLAVHMEDQCAALQRGEEISRRELRYIQRALHHEHLLIWFEDMLLQRDVQLQKKYIQAVETAFFANIEYFRTAGSMKRALYAHLIMRFHIGEGQGNMRLEGLLMQFLEDPSLYCRDAALKALLTIAEDEDITDIFARLNTSRHFFFSKAIMEAFNCVDRQRQERYIRRLLPNINTYEEELQVALLKVIRKVQPDCGEELLELLRGEKTLQSVKVEIIRFFKTVHYEPAREELLQILTYPRKQYRRMIIASLWTLKEYYGEDVKEEARKLLQVKDFDIQEAAAEVLVEKGVTYRELSAFYNGNDEQVRRILRYMNEVRGTDVTEVYG